MSEGLTQGLHADNLVVELRSITYIFILTLLMGIILPYLFPKPCTFFVPFSSLLPLAFFFISLSHPLLKLY